MFGTCMLHVLSANAISWWEARFLIWTAFPNAKAVGAKSKQTQAVKRVLSFLFKAHEPFFFEPLLLFGKGLSLDASLIFHFI